MYVCMCMHRVWVGMLIAGGSSLFSFCCMLKYWLPTCQRDLSMYCMHVRIWVHVRTVVVVCDA